MLFPETGKKYWYFDYCQKYAIGERYSVPNWTKENDKVISTYSNKKPNA